MISSAVFRRLADTLLLMKCVTIWLRCLVFCGSASLCFGKHCCTGRTASFKVYLARFRVVGSEQYAFVLADQAPNEPLHCTPSLLLECCGTVCVNKPLINPCTFWTHAPLIRTSPFCGPIPFGFLLTTPMHHLETLCERHTRTHMMDTHGHTRTLGPALTWTRAHVLAIGHALDPCLWTI